MKDLKTYYFSLSVERREAFVAACATTRGHMQNVAYGYRPASPTLAVAVERHSGGEVLADDVLKATWQRVPDATWPHPMGRPLLDLSVAIEKEGA